MYIHSVQRRFCAVGREIANSKKSAKSDEASASSASMLATPGAPDCMEKYDVQASVASRVSLPDVLL